MSANQRVKNAGYEAIRRVYNSTLRQILPRTTALMNGVHVREPALLDRNTEFPRYEAAYCRAIRRAVHYHDHVTLIGAGRGVSSVHAINAGAASVVAYEAAPDRVSQARETAEMNGHGERITVHHGLVGGAGVVDAEKVGPEVSVAGLPPCNLLALDCEGAETAILDRLDLQPRSIVVETHEMYGTTPDSVASLLPEYEPTDTLSEEDGADAGTAVVTLEVQD